FTAIRRASIAPASSPEQCHRLKRWLHRFALESVVALEIFNRCGSAKEADDACFGRKPDVFYRQSEVR
ncbi:MAG: hypothetical protein WBV18_02120, partial [Methyloceanibacter sp.]|uniref:hypothetical protein n=1 Tax=Methyloceanibacter sp. TaxID=1965321 RepID=UPI003C4EB8FB